MAKAILVYWSMTGNTEQMAELIAQGYTSVDNTLSVRDVSSANLEEVIVADKLILGCPAMGDENLEEMEFQPFYDQLRPHLMGKKVALFGSYGWGDGQWMRSWEADVRDAGAELFETGLIQLNSIDGEEEKAIDFGKRFATA